MKKKCSILRKILRRSTKQKIQVCYTNLYMSRLEIIISTDLQLAIDEAVLASKKALAVSLNILSLLTLF